jgi:hypothetical protein
MNTLAACPVLRRVVGRNDGPGAFSFGIEAPIAIPRAYIQNRFTLEVDLVELILDEPPQEADVVDIVDFRSSAQAVPEIEVVVPLDLVDACLKIFLRHGGSPARAIIVGCVS